MIRRASERALLNHLRRRVIDANPILMFTLELLHAFGRLKPSRVKHGTWGRAPPQNRVFRAIPRENALLISRPNSFKTEIAAKCKQAVRVI
ncbi:Uncharacterised protein [Vibrio cholerae]|uniref:Uncharacterized protein n=1 Tax=Vibrio cholerae TaxID=666 RepID=A0A655W7L6_VIBCL|nr:Uncharacterised protein [Vibrio cholerae]CSB83091.1 Uncharacterised protein [Vibrio cholerae]CSC17101.1 Uncharacterised protein [Vibrio cholerae]CSI63626.1 Uncharacterised protein [Vibrio cholerae]